MEKTGNTTTAPSFNSMKLFKSISNTIEDTKEQVLAQFSDHFSFNNDEPLSDDDDNIPFNHRHRSREKKLKDDELVKVTEDIRQFADYLKLTPLQTIVFVAYLTGELTDNRQDDSVATVKNFLMLDSLDSIALKPEIKHLIDHGYLRVQYSRRGESVNVDKTLVNAIVDNLPFELSEQLSVDRYTFCAKIAAMLDKSQQENIGTREIIEAVRNYEKEYADLKFIKETKRLIDKSDADTTDAAIFYYVCDGAANGTRNSVSDILSMVYNRTSERIRNSNDFIDGIHPLQKLDLVELAPGGFFQESTLKLTDNGRKLFMEEDYRTKSKKIKDVIDVADIKTKELFYDSETAHQIDFLRNSLDGKQFDKMQKRLEAQSLPKGIAVLLYGAPGTGKTETVMQIAKATKRRIMHVDISHSKSCYLGESEKLIKKIFTNYKSLCETEKRKPILLFNEADAIFSKRYNVNQNSVSQTLNAMQNIILEEMETFDGILIATTNLANNLDEAFDRRFLFKMEFQRPTIEAKQHMWKSKLPMLNDDECKKLAMQYDLSGGEIDNIVRKVTMNEVLYGAVPTIEYINELCRNERINARNGSCKVGF